MATILENPVLAYLREKNPFVDGPADFLAEVCLAEMKAEPRFAKIFRSSMDSYQRDDYSAIQFPALRLYSLRATKGSDSGYVTGTVTADVIWPQSLRRGEQFKFPDIVSSGIMQHFRRHRAFFDKVLAQVPGLTELGRSFDVDKTLGFVWKDEVLPTTQMTFNFKIDLRLWDDHLEATLRTEEEPFEQTLEALELIGSEIAAVGERGGVVTVEGPSFKPGGK